MAPNDCSSLEEFNRRYERSLRIEGEGRGVTMHYPCPGCAAPNWATVVVVNGAVPRGVTACGACGRSFEYLANTADAILGVELVQRAGDALPAWYRPAMRRDDPSTPTPA